MPAQTMKYVLYALGNFCYGFPLFPESDDF